MCSISGQALFRRASYTSTSGIGGWHSTLSTYLFFTQLDEYVLSTSYAFDSHIPKRSHEYFSKSVFYICFFEAHSQEPSNEGVMETKQHN